MNKAKDATIEFDTRFSQFQWIFQTMLTLTQKGFTRIRDRYIDRDRAQFLKLQSKLKNVYTCLRVAFVFKYICQNSGQWESLFNRRDTR